MALLGYARVSRDDQDPTRQHDALAAAGVARERVWTDHGVSGALASRPQLDALLAYARDGDVIVTHDLSRLGRSLRNLVVLVVDLAGRGIGIRSLSQGIDTTNGPTGTILVSMFAALAEIERTILVERTRDGLTAARARGRVGGRPVVVSPEQLASARVLLDAGQSAVTVARTLGVSRSSLYRAIAREGANVAP